jgi:hypothetical protein
MNPTRKDGEPLAIEVEMRREAASALGAAGRRLEAAVASFRSAAGAYERSPTAGGQREVEDARRRLAHQLWLMVVQREAMGISRHEGIYGVYEVPRDVEAKPLL